MKTLEFESNIYDIIRVNIKRYRKQRKMTAAELSELIDVSHEFIRQIESKKVATNFSVDTLYRISVALDVGVDDLMKKHIDNENEPTK